MTATIKPKGSIYSNSVLGAGMFILKYPMVLLYLSLRVIEEGIDDYNITLFIFA
jgi:hypothetical protein